MKTSRIFAAIITTTTTLLVLALAASAETMTMTTTTTAAYAQQQQGKACPPGFTLSKGMCSAAPVVTFECGNAVYNEEIRLCEEFAQFTPTCPSTAAYNSDLNQCATVDEETGEVINAFNPECGGNSKLNPDTDFCERYTTFRAGISTFCAGASMLNSAQTMCEVKPGRRAA